MSDFALVASLVTYVGFTMFVYQNNHKMLPSMLAGIVYGVLMASILHVGMYADAATFGSALLLGSILAPVLAIDAAGKKAFVGGNSVLVSRDAFAGMSMPVRTARPLVSRVIPQSHAA